MKKISLILLLMTLVGCTTISQPVIDNELKIVTTIFPITDLTERITGMKATQLLPDSGANAHTWEPSPQDIILLEEADVFVYNGAGMEEWVDDVLESLGNKDLVIIEASKDVEKIDTHHHDHDHKEEHDHDHEEETFDPHTWSSPKSARVQLETIGNTLINNFEEYSTVFNDNLNKNLILFDELDTQYETQLEAFHDKTLVVQHEAYGYLAHDYHLNQVGIEGLVPTSEPDLARMVDIIKLVDELKVKTIFFEENVSDKVASTLADETGAKTAVLSTLAFKVNENDDLISMMRNNLEVLVEGLK